ncbi:hypothetical protein Tco_0871807 [Tanacetum coccineum]
MTAGHSRHVSDLPLPIRLFTLRLDLGVFHMMILRGVLPTRILYIEDEAPIPLLQPSFIVSHGFDLFSPRHSEVLLLAACEDSQEPTIETRSPRYREEDDDRPELGQQEDQLPVDVCTRESSGFAHDITMTTKDRAAVRAELEIVRKRETCLTSWRVSEPSGFGLARSEAHCRALEARVTVLETEVHRHEWQRQAADDLAVQYIMRTQALEAGARVDTLEDTGSSS